MTFFCFLIFLTWSYWVRMCPIKTLGKISSMALSSNHVLSLRLNSYCKNAIWICQMNDDITVY